MSVAQKPWLRIIAEGVAILVSILLAFAIDAWWDGRQVEAVERQLLTSLAVALETNSGMAGQRARDVVGDRSLLQRFIGMTAEEAGELPSDSTWVVLRSLWRPSSGGLNSAEVTAVLDSNPALLRDHPDLQRAMASWRDSAGRLEMQNVQLAAITEEVINALAEHRELQPAFAQLPGARTIPGSVTRDVREDNEVMRLAARKGFNTQIQILFLEQVKSNAEDALSLLRSRSLVR